jgi:hypothetical protein
MSLKNFRNSARIGTDGKSFLAAGGKTSTNTSVVLNSRDDASGRQRWVLTDFGKTTYRLTVSGGRDGPKVLSASPTKNAKVVLVDKDDGSGRQKWKFTQVGDLWEISVLNGAGLQSPKDNVLHLIGNGSDDVVLRAAEAEGTNARRFQLWKMETAQTAAPTTPAPPKTTTPSTTKPSGSGAPTHVPTLITPPKTTTPSTTEPSGSGAPTHVPTLIPPFQTTAPGELTTLPPNASCFLSPEQVQSGSSLSPPQLPYCTRAPTAFESETCRNAVSNLVYRDMYNTTFGYCVFPGGRSCQVEDVATGWCSAPSTPTPSPCPTEQPFPWITAFPQTSGRENPVAPIVPGLLGTANTNVEGSSASGSDGLAYSAYGADVQNKVGDPTQFFADQLGLANTGVTSDTVSQLAQAQAIAANNPASSGSSDFAPSVPQPFPVITATEAPATQAPTPATMSPTAQVLEAMLAATSTADPSSPAGFFRLTNPLFLLALGILLILIFFIWRKFGRKAQTADFSYQ